MAQRLKKARSKRVSKTGKRVHINVDKHRWRKVCLVLFPVVISISFYYVFYPNNIVRSAAAILTLSFVLALALVLLEWYVWRNPDDRRVPRIVFGGVHLLCLITTFVWYWNMPAQKTWLMLSEADKKEFISILKSQTDVRDRVQIGCPPGNEEICVRATWFVEAFKRGGFFVENDRVERVLLSHPTPGVSILKYGHADIFDAQNPDLGKWSRITESLATVDRAFARVGINPGLAVDEALPENVIAIFFGIEPSEPGEPNNLRELKTGADKEANQRYPIR